MLDRTKTITAAAIGNPDEDRRFMAAALALGRRNMGATWPNPSVGALLVQHTEVGAVIVGRGWTAKGGRPHGEPRAIAAAGDNARGATCYVTLEPCAHHGRTTPCADALIAAGVARVVSAVEDPDPRVRGKGHGRLAAAGIAVTTGVLEAEARRDHAGHFTRILLGRPHVQLKLATSSDGMIAIRGQGGLAITGAEVRDRVHLMRAEADAIVVGIGTALADDPMLTCRLPGLEGRSPVRVVIDGRARLPLTSALVRSVDEVPLWLVVDDRAPVDRRIALEALGVELIEAPLGPDGRTDLAGALVALAERGITRAMVEGGAAIARALLEADLVDEALLLTAAEPIGSSGLPAFVDRGPDLLVGGGRFAELDAGMIGQDEFRHFWRER